MTQVTNRNFDIGKARVISIDDCPEDKDYGNKKHQNISAAFYSQSRQALSAAGSDLLQMPPQQMLRNPKKAHSQGRRSAQAYHQQSSPIKDRSYQDNSTGSLSARQTSSSSALSVRQPAQRGDCQLTRYLRTVNKARDLNRKLWERNIVYDEERLSSKASTASLRADKELHETSSYLEEKGSCHDTVNQIQEALQSMEDQCTKKMNEIDAEQRRVADIERRKRLIKERRNGLGNNDRALAFGNIKNGRNQQNQAASSWNSNCQVKKNLRANSVELNPVTRGGAAASIKPKAVIAKPTRESMNKQAVKNRLNLLNDVFGSFSYRSDSEEEYDSEY